MIKSWIGYLIPLIAVLPLLISKIPLLLRQIYAWFLFAFLAFGMILFGGLGALVFIALVLAYVSARKAYSTNKENKSLRRLYIALTLISLFCGIVLPFILSYFQIHFEI